MAVQTDRQTDQQPHSSQDSMVLLLWAPPWLSLTFPSGSCVPSEALSSVITRWPLKAQATLCSPLRCSVEGISPDPGMLHLLSAEVLSLQSVGLERGFNPSVPW